MIDPSLENLYTVLAFDPGGTTGWSVISIYDGVIGPPPFRTWIMEWEYSRGGYVGDPGPILGALEEARLAYKAEVEGCRNYKILDNVAFWAAGQFTGDRGNQVDEMVALTSAWPASAPLVVEDFILRQFRMDRVLLEPVRVTERYRHAVRDLGRAGELWRREVALSVGSAEPVGRYRDVILQPASIALSMVTDERLKRIAGAGLGFFPSTAGAPHARDAVRHALTFLRREKEARSLGKTLEVC